MSLLKPAVKQTAFAKLGVLGFAGSGKTYTSAKIMLGIAKKLGSDKPVGFFDSETGSDYVIEMYEKAGVPLLVFKSKSFKDCLQVIQEAEQQCSGLIIDSITHIWKDLIDSYLASKGSWKTNMEFQDWGPVKKRWQEYTELFVNSKLHIIVCGRAGYEYEYLINDNGKRELQKTGTKMKTESEFGFEPSFIIEMEKGTRYEKSKKISSNYDHIATVIKDRNDKMNGQQVTNPIFESFQPYWDFLNIGGEHVGVQKRNSEEMFEKTDGSHHEVKKKKKLALDEILSSLNYCWPGRTAEAMAIKTEVFLQVFETTSWDVIQEKKISILEAGRIDILKLRENYANLQDKSVPIKDNIPTYIKSLLPQDEPAAYEDATTTPPAESKINKDGFLVKSEYKHVQNSYKMLSVPDRNKVFDEVGGFEFDSLTSEKLQQVEEAIKKIRLAKTDDAKEPQKKLPKEEPLPDDSENPKNDLPGEDDEEDLGL